MRKTKTGWTASSSALPRYAFITVLCLPNVKNALFRTPINRFSAKKKSNDEKMRFFQSDSRQYWFSGIYVRIACLYARTPRAFNLFALSVQLERSAETAITEVRFDANPEDFSPIPYWKMRLRAFLIWGNADSDAACILFCRVYRQKGTDMKC